MTNPLHEERREGPRDEHFHPDQRICEEHSRIIGTLLGRLEGIEKGVAFIADQNTTYRGTLDARLETMNKRTDKVVQFIDRQKFGVALFGALGTLVVTVLTLWPTIKKAVVGLVTVLKFIFS